jgi:hypothetical protein
MPGALTGALIHLAVQGVIRRYPETGRLDSPKYLYELRHPDDRPDFEQEGDTATIERNATRLFLQRHGPATIDEIAEWASLTKGAVRKALGAIRAERITVAGWTSEAWLLPEDVRAWKTFAGEEDRVVLLPYRDPVTAVRRPPAALSTDDRAQVLNEHLRPVEIRTVNRLIHHAIVAGGELVGIWEYQPETESVVTRLWQDNKDYARVAPRHWPPDASFAISSAMPGCLPSIHRRRARRRLPGAKPDLRQPPDGRATRPERATSIDH